jgi:hypothetical protein
MKYESEFEIVETINSTVTKKQHVYTRLNKVTLCCADEDALLTIWDLRANHPVGGTKPKRSTYLQEKLELGYCLYTTTNIHPLHLYFFRDISREMWRGFLYGKAHEHKKYKTAEWYDLLHPLPFYPNLSGFCHVKEPVLSCAEERVRQYTPQNDIEAFSLEWTLRSLERYAMKLTKHTQDKDAILIGTNDVSFSRNAKFQVISS